MLLGWRGQNSHSVLCKKLDRELDGVELEKIEGEFRIEQRNWDSDFSFVVVVGWSRDTCHEVDASVMAPCRFGEVCWRPLCPNRHIGKGRAARWAAVWTLLAGQVEEVVGGQGYLQGVLLRAHRGADRRDRCPA